MRIIFSGVVVVLLLLLPPLETTSRTSSRTRFLPPRRSLLLYRRLIKEISARPRWRARRDTPVRTRVISNRSPFRCTVETDTRDCCSPLSSSLKTLMEIRRRRPRTRSKTSATSSRCDNTHHHRSRRRLRRRRRRRRMMRINADFWSIFLRCEKEREG